MNLKCIKNVYFEDEDIFTFLTNKIYTAEQTECGMLKTLNNQGYYSYLDTSSNWYKTHFVEI